MHAVDADQLDVGGRRAAGDPGHRAGGVLAEDLDGLGHRGDDVGGLEDDDVGVGHQRDRAAALAGLTVEDACAGQGDGDAAACDDGVALVQLQR